MAYYTYLGINISCVRVASFVHTHNTELNDEAAPPPDSLQRLESAARRTSTAPPSSNPRSHRKQTRRGEAHQKRVEVLKAFTLLLNIKIFMTVCGVIKTITIAISLKLRGVLFCFVDRGLNYVTRAKPTTSKRIL